MLGPGQLCLGDLFEDQNINGLDRVFTRPPQLSYCRSFRVSIYIKFGETTKDIDHIDHRWK